MFQSTPTVKSIFYINVVAFLLTLLLPNLMYGLFSLNNPDLGFQFITYQFIHGGFLHIIFNMLVLLSFGPSVEEIYGGRKMWIYYLLCGIAGAALHLYMVGSSNPLVGASGSIWGIMVIFTLMYPNQSMYFMFLPAPIKAKYIIGGLFLIEVISGFNSHDNVSHFGHVGGALMGGLIYLSNKRRF
jgi:membrane associated rhomboid family serine protease